ncbi:MAG TPA: hypothetical protein VN180_03210 [Acidimicrobiia bacterium]|nr:hypothetical protein [Acidimicrobiia bacterium]
MWELLDDDGVAATSLDDEDVEDEELEGDVAPVVVAVAVAVPLVVDDAVPLDAAPVAITATSPPKATADVAAATRRARAAG